FSLWIILFRYILVNQVSMALCILFFFAWACISFRHKFSPVVLVLYEIKPYFYLTWVFYIRESLC
ncbi:hypothetical protein OLS49_08035, partial [Campylobacter jejuni]|nr:hypothetical protein [Campylobacter jejuni]